MKPAPTHSYPGLNLGRRHASAHKATEVVTFGFWVFLMSDLVYFGLMFGVYITMIDAQAGGPGPHELFDLYSIFAQTLILLTSSLTVGLAMLALKYNLPRGRIVLWFGVTLLLGLSWGRFIIRRATSAWQLKPTRMHSSMAKNLLRHTQSTS